MKNYSYYHVESVTDLKDMLEKSALKYGSKPAFWSKDKGTDKYVPTSYTQYKHDVDSLGTKLIDMGLKGKRIALIGESRYEWAVSYLAVLCGVGIIVPLDKELPENEIESLLRRSKSDAVIFSERNREQIMNISEMNETIKFYIDMDKDEDDEKVLSFKKLLESGAELLEKGDTKLKDSIIDVNELNILLFTSGTTDMSKAVMLCQRNICSNLMDMGQMIKIATDDIFLSVLPIHHTYECTCGFLFPIFSGAAVAYCEGLRHIVKNLKESKATIMLGVPLIFESMYKKVWEQAEKSGKAEKLKTAIKISNVLRKIGINLTKKLFAPIHDTLGGNLRLMVSGAAGIDPNVSKGLRDFGFSFLQGYGLTECSPILTVNRDYYFKDASAGIAVEHVEIKIDQPGSDGVGEIIARGPNIMMGYYENEEATDKVLKDEWFYTGDLGYMDSEGFIYITGRKKNVIITKNGKNIYPEEIETLLNRSPYIKESLVYGKDDKAEEDIVLAAVIVPNLENIQEGQDVRKLIHDEIKVVNKGLVLYKYIRDFEIRETEFEKTTTKKIKRYKV